MVADASSAGRTGLARGRWGWDEAELLDHLEPVITEAEGDVLAVAVVEHVDVIDCDGAAGGRDVAGWAAQDAVVCSGKDAFLDCDIAGDVEGMDIDVGVGEGTEPAGEELSAGRLSLAGDPAWRAVGNVVGEHAGEPVDVMSVECVGALLERLAYGHRHRSPLC